MTQKLSDLIKKNRFTLPAALILWAVTFVTDTRIFSSDGLNMNCLPVDTKMIPFMHILTKICVLLLLYGLIRFLIYAFMQKSILFVFLFFMAVYGTGLLVTWPGYYMNDDPIIFAYATRYLPVYWHNYLTSLFYMVSMSVFPASCGPVLLSDVCYALTFTYLFDRGGRKIILVLPGLLPFVLLGALMCFRPAVYSSFFLFYFLILFFDHRQKTPLTPGRFILLSFLTAVLCLWRSESIILLPLSVILIPLTYHHKNEAGKNEGWIDRLHKHPLRLAALFLFAAVAFFLILSMPQKHGENKYYGSDYLIISTTRPLSVIVWRDQTYEGADEDIANISAVTEFGYLHNDSLSCSAYTRYNSDHNEGRYTQTGADRETQKKYLKSAFRLILHNLDLYFGERLQLFLITNGYFNYDSSMVLDLDPIVSTDFHLYDHDKDYGMEMLNAYLRLPLEHHDGYALFLYKYGGEAFIPVMLLCFAFMIVFLVRKKWLCFFIFASFMAREAVIFLTAPTSFIQYSYPSMFAVSALLLILLSEHLPSFRSSKQDQVA